jgi:hypothetical protein
MCLTNEEKEKYFPVDSEEETRNIIPSTRKDKEATDETSASGDAANSNTTQPTVQNKERNQWELGLRGLHNPPHQPLTAYALGLRKYEGGLQQIKKFKDTIADTASDFEESKVISENMTLEKLLVAVRICRTMTLFDLKRAVANVVSQPRKREQLSER